jgi:hypothetical protein
MSKPPWTSTDPTSRCSRNHTSLTYSRMSGMQHQLSNLTFPRNGSERSNQPTMIMVHARLAQGPDNRRGAKRQHRVLGKHPLPNDMTQKQARDTMAGGDRGNLVRSCTGSGGSTQGGRTLRGTITGGSYNPGGTWPPTIGTQNGMINITQKSRT